MINQLEPLENNHSFSTFLKTQGNSVLIISETKLFISIEAFLKQIHHLSLSGFNVLILREKALSFQAYTELISTLNSKVPNLKIILHGKNGLDYLLNTKNLSVQIQGLHLPLPFIEELQEETLLNCLYKVQQKQLFLGTSVHNQKEYLMAQKFNCHYHLIGPVFNTRCKPDAKPKGLNFLKDFYINYSNNKTQPIALGGINFENQNKIHTLGYPFVAMRSEILTRKY